MSEDFVAIFDDDKYPIGDYLPLKTLGRGAFAEVKLAQHLLTGTKVAIKTIDQRSFSRQFQELHCLQTLRHPNIATLLEVITTQDKHILILEYVSGGDLHAHLRKCRHKTEEEARAMFRQLISAVQYCHQKGITHRDLKPENILLDRDLNIKVVDFGFGREFTNYTLTTFCGTLSHMAPEILQRQPYEGPKVDVWSLGITLYTMLTGDEPFVGDNPARVLKEILKRRLHLPYFTSMECRELLKKLLTVDPNQRPNLEDIMKDPWITMSQKEHLRPYREPPWGVTDPQVIKIMEDMGFKKQDIEDSLAQKKYDRVMGTYLILRMGTNEMNIRTINVRPCPSCDLSSGASTSHVVGPVISSPAPLPGLDSSSIAPPGSKQARNKDAPTRVEVRLAVPPASLESRSITPPPNLEERVTAPLCNLEERVTLTAQPPSLEKRVTIPSLTLKSISSTSSPNLDRKTITPLPDPESRTTTPSSAIQCGPGDASIRSSSSSTAGAPEAAQPDGGTLVSLAGLSHGRKGVAGRVLRFFLNCICCQPCMKKHHPKRTRIKPMQFLKE